MIVRVKYRSPLLKILIPGSFVIISTGIILYCGFTYLKISGIILSIAFATTTLFAMTGIAILLNPLTNLIAKLPSATLEIKNDTISWVAGFNRGKISLAKPHIAEIYTGSTVSGKENKGAGFTLQNKNDAISIAMTGIEVNEILKIIEDEEFTRTMPLMKIKPFFPFVLSATGDEKIEFFTILSALWNNRQNNLSYISHIKFPWNHITTHKGKYAEILDSSNMKEKALINKIKKKSFFAYKEKLFVSPDNLLVELEISVSPEDLPHSAPFYCSMPVGCTEASMESEYDPNLTIGSIMRLALHSFDNEGKRIKTLLEWPERQAMSMESLDIENLMKYLSLQKNKTDENPSSH